MSSFRGIQPEETLHDFFEGEKAIKDPLLPTDTMGKTRPGKPKQFGKISTDSIEILWDKPEKAFEGGRYLVRYKQEGSTWQLTTDEFHDCIALVRGLIPDTPYMFQVKVVDIDNHESTWSPTSDAIRTKTKPANSNEIVIADLQSIRKVHVNSGNPSCLNDTHLLMNTMDQTRPGKPKQFGKISTDSIEILWDKPEKAFEGGRYLVRYKEDGSTWQLTTDEFYDCIAQVRGLIPDTLYMFQVQMVDIDNHESAWSPTSDAIRTKTKPANSDEIDSSRSVQQKNDPSSTPSKSKADVLPFEEQYRPNQPFEVACETTANSIVLFWEMPKMTSKGDRYKVSYKRVPHDTHWTSPDSAPASDCSARITGLKGNTEYVFRVRMVDEAGDEYGRWSPESDIIKTAQSPAYTFLPFTELISGAGTAREIRKFCFKEDKSARNMSKEMRKLMIGPPDKLYRHAKTILFVGETGSGKSTMIDRLINYVFCVDWDDKIRFTVVDREESEKKKQFDQTVSQTEWVTTYSIAPLNGGRLDYRLNIIDTPGFGDTDGRQRDDKIKSQIETLFNHKDKSLCNVLDAVCFVTKASSVRMGAVQKKICKTMVGIFTKDLAQNFALMTTYACGDAKDAESAMKKAGVPFVASYAFENLNFHEFSDEAEILWKKGDKSCSEFFRDLRTKLKPISISLTQSAVLDRRSAEDYCRQLQKLISHAIKERSLLVKSRKSLLKTKEQLEKNRNYAAELKENIDKNQADLVKHRDAISRLEAKIRETQKRCTIPKTMKINRKCATVDSEKCQNCSICEKTCNRGLGITERVFNWCKELFGATCSECPHKLENHMIEEKEFISKIIMNKEALLMEKKSTKLTMEKDSQTEKSKNADKMCQNLKKMLTETETLATKTHDEFLELCRGAEDLEDKISANNKEISMFLAKIEICLCEIQKHQFIKPTYVTVESFVESLLAEEEKSSFKSYMAFMRQISVH